MACGNFPHPLFNVNVFRKQIDRVGNTGNGGGRLLIDTPMKYYRPDGTLLTFSGAEAGQALGVSTRGTEICTSDALACGCN
jgi:hypothetical protein